tara:strand:+ start:12190 stop:12498 length:309 start_codon:yes stop_codon:yes gene_type:complete
MTIKILNFYDTREEAENDLAKLEGEKKIVSDREDNQVIYKLFGLATWGNFYRLDMFNLKELKTLLENRKNNNAYNEKRHHEILQMLKYSAQSFELEVPDHWK